MSGIQCLATSWLGRYYEHFDTLESTNKYLIDYSEGLPHGAAITASIQTVGRGRLGRSWGSVKDKGLALSFLVKGFEPSGLAGLPLVTGIAVSRVLERLCGAPAPIKWSNDVLLGDKKVCGILCEGRISGENSFAVVGIGVNLTHSETDFERLGLEYAASVKLVTGKIFDFTELCADILNEIEPLIEDYGKFGFIYFHKEYTKRCITVGREVRITSGTGTICGTALGVSENGELVCSVDGKIHSVNSGVVSVRGLYGYV